MANCRHPRALRWIRLSLLATAVLRLAAQDPVIRVSVDLVEAQLWTFVGPPGILFDDHAPEVHWVAAESLDAALGYMRRRFDDFTITEARFLGMIPLLSGSPLEIGRAHV